MRNLDESVMRQPPANIDAEQALIGAVLLNNDAYRKVASVVEPAHFYEGVHRQIWQVMIDVIAAGGRADPVLLKGHLGDADLGNGMTPLQYLARLSAEATTVMNAPEYAKQVRDMALRRKLISIGQSLTAIAYDAPVQATAETIFADLERDLEEVRPALSGQETDFRDFGRISSEDVYDAYQRQSGIVGLSTGLQRLDDVLGGLQPSDLIVLAGRPGAGKTALATNIALSVARHVMARLAAGERLGVVGFSSLEMGERQLKQRILSDLARVPFWKLKRGLADKAEMERYTLAEREFAKLPLLIDPTGGLSIAQLKIRARALKKRRGLSLLVVDYLQLLTGSGRRSDNRVAEVTEITTGLKALAKELDVPIIALSQLSRKVEERDDKRPMLADLRESGSIEQDADSVLFVYREEYYLRKMEPRQEGTEQHAKWQAAMRKWQGVAEIIIGKNRHGPEGTAELGFEGQFTRFTNEPEPREIEPEAVRQKIAKKPSVGKDGTILWGVLKNLTLHRGQIASQGQRAADKKLCKGARLVPVEDCWRAFGGEICPTETEDKQKAAFRLAMKSLRAAEIARYHGVEETGFFVWLPEMAADV
ncbi:replicative DNA helicase [Methylorubrum zatmanii]